MSRDPIDIQQHQLAPATQCECGSCTWTGPIEDTLYPDGALLTPGDTVPAGRCPRKNCGALAYIKQKRNRGVTLTLNRPDAHALEWIASYGADERQEEAKRHSQHYTRSERAKIRRDLARASDAIGLLQAAIGHSPRG